MIDNAIAVHYTALTLLAPRHLYIDSEQSVFGEKVVFSGLLGEFITNKGQVFSAKIEGSISKNIESYEASRPSEIKITVSDGNETIGYMILGFSGGSSKILQALELPEASPQPLFITGYVQAIRPRVGIGTWLMDFGERSMPAILATLVNFNILPQATDCVRFYKDITKDGDAEWTTRYLAEHTDSLRPLIKLKNYDDYVRYFSPEKTISQKQQDRLQMEAREKISRLKKQIMAKFGLNSESDLEKLNLPNFDSDTGRNIQGLLSEQLSALL
ncbi:MAG: hypothetical protein GW947_04555 [Candidatus Pacebacteria bacterium]|nr:hypothetical protein [Candidatus Paceibacterota bacterium]